MDETKAAKSPQESPNQPQKANKPNLMARLNTWFFDIVGEFRKIIWPSRTELQKETVTVIFTSLLFGVVIFGLNTIFSASYNFLLSLVSKG